MVIKRDEGTKTPDIPVFRNPAPVPSNRGPDIPVYIDIPIVTTRGGRADAPNTGPGGSGIVDIFNRGNNPFQVSKRFHQLLVDRLVKEKIVAAEAAAQVAIRLCA